MTQIDATAKRTPSTSPAIRAADALRILSAECVQKANSGHPGLPMGAADLAFVLWTRFLKHDPSDPQWPDRDRFVLSAGHGSMLLYSLLHLTGYDLSLDDLKNFRQWGSRTPGHPEYGHAPGVETTTGPLGQGAANAVGMALAEAMLAARFNTEDDPIVNHFTYALVSDGDLMEGVASEAASLAGFLRLGKLIFIYDDNKITIEGSTDLTFSNEDIQKRFEAYGWHTQRIDGHDHEQIAGALQAAKDETGRPSIIIARTHIGLGSPNQQDTPGVHGSPLGEEELQRTREALDWNAEPFQVPEAILALFRESGQRAAEACAEWKKRFEAWRAAEPEKAALWDAMIERRLPDDLDRCFPEFEAGKSIATRKASGATLQALAPLLPQLVGGSADLGPSNNTMLKDFSSVAPNDYSGRNLHFGIREHAMGGLLNGLSLHGGFTPYGATFLVFSDYMRPSVRLAALMNQQAIYVWTHDSIFLGEDGPTHQPIEHLSSLRTIPNLFIIRPSDASEVPYAWEVALRRKDGPTALILTRQGIPTLNRHDEAFAPADQLRQGGYILAEASVGKPKILLAASGSEVQLALGAREILEEKGIATRVVAMPCMELFQKQDKAYRDSVLPPEVRARVAIEAGSRPSWDWLIGSEGDSVTIDGRFGASAPCKVLAEKFGFTTENVAEVAWRLL